MSSVILLSMVSMIGLMLFLQQLGCDQQDTVDGVRKWLVDCNVEGAGLASFDLSDNSGDINVKNDGCVLDEKSLFKML